jgi:hypothetical protein
MRARAAAVVSDAELDLRSRDCVVVCLDELGETPVDETVVERLRARIERRALFAKTTKR